MVDGSSDDPYAAFRVRDYRFFVAGLFLSVLGSQIQFMTVTYEVFQRTRSELSLGWVGLALAVPILLLALPAGSLADRRSRRRVHMVTQLGCGLCVLGLAGLSLFASSWAYSIPAIYALLMLGNASATLGRPSRASLMPSLVPRDVFRNAVTWNTSLFEAGSAIGPAIGGLVCAFSIPMAYGISAACFIGSAILTFALPNHRPTPKESGSSLDDFVAGVRFVWRSKMMLGAMTLDLFAVLLGGAVFLLPVFAEEILKVGPIGFGFLRAAPSIGASVMALALAHMPIRRAGSSMLMAVTGFGIATVVFGLSRNYFLSFAMLALTGALDNISVVIRHTMIQMLTPDHMRGRVNAVNQIFIGSSNELGGLESGVTAHWWGPVRSVVVGGIGTIAVVAGCAMLFPQLGRVGSLRDLKSEDLDEPARSAEAKS